MYVVCYSWPDNGQTQYFGPYLTFVRAEGDMLRFCKTRDFVPEPYEITFGDGMDRVMTSILYEADTEEGLVYVEIAKMIGRFPSN